MKIEASLRDWFPEDFSRKTSPVNSDYLWPPPPPSSSSSSLRSLDSPQNASEYSSLLFPLTPKPSTTTDAVNVPLLAPGTTVATTNMIHQQQQEPLFRNREREDEVMARAILAVITASSSPSSTSSSPQRKGRATAFKRYYCMTSGGGGSGVRRQSMMRRAISYYNRLNIDRRERFVRENATDGGGDGSGGGRVPTATQLHHMISERKRREKLNDSFQALRSLLPPGTKVCAIIFFYIFFIFLYILSSCIQ